MPRKPKEENDQLAKAIGEQITAAMGRLNITMTELHKRTGISRTVLLAYTRGTYAPGARELKLLCENLDVTPTVLIYGSNQVATTPYRLGDMAISENGADTIALLLLVGQLTQSERRSLLTLVDGISAARNPQAHRQVMEVMDVVLRDEGFAQMMKDFAGQFEVSEILKNVSAQVEKVAPDLK